MRAGLIVVVCLGIALPAGATATRLAPAELPWLDPEEATALLADLEEAGLLPADLDLTGLTTPAPDANDAGPTPTWSWRLETTDDGRLGSSLDGRAGPVAWRLRARRGTEDATEVGGCVWVDDPRWAAAVGGVGVQHGLGLLAAGPGRNRTASLGGSLLPGDLGPRRWSSPDGASGVRGAVAEWRTRIVVAGAMVGRIETDHGDSLRTERVAWLALQRAGLALSVLSRLGGVERGHSLAGKVTQGALDVRAEAAVWREAAGTGSARAAAAAARWRGRKGAVEVLAATATAATGPVLGSRPACLLGWDGRGWAVRGRLALSATLTGTVLAAATEDRPSRTSTRDRTVRQTLEAGVRGRCPRQGTWAVRWRRREDARWVADEAAPWRPPRAEKPQVSDTFLGEGALRVGEGELAGAIRWVVQERDDERGRRAVASLIWRGPVGPLRATLGRGWAWGDPVAVSTVTTPVSGLVVPRAWSAWSDEIHAGAELAAGPWRVQIAAARRTPAYPDAGPPVWQGWLRLAVAW